MSLMLILNDSSLFYKFVIHKIYLQPFAFYWSINFPLLCFWALMEMIFGRTETKDINQNFQCKSDILEK